MKSRGCQPSENASTSFASTFCHSSARLAVGSVLKIKRSDFPVQVRVGKLKVDLPNLCKEEKELDLKD